jgi:hypothetical protein
MVAFVPLAMVGFACASIEGTRDNSRTMRRAIDLFELVPSTHHPYPGGET